jgi:type IV secretory pathway component VirB8
MKIPQITIKPKALDAETHTRELLVDIIQAQRKTNVRLVIAIIALAIAFVMAMPLKETIPYVVTNNKVTGEVTAPAAQSAGAFVPSPDNIAFFAKRFIEAAFSIHPQLSQSVYDPLAKSYLRGSNAIAKFAAYRKQDKYYERIVQDPTLVRSVTVNSLQPVAGAKQALVANLTLRTTSRGEIVEEQKLLTLYYELLTPQNPGDREQHPIGLFIIDLEITNSAK